MMNRETLIRSLFFRAAFEQVSRLTFHPHQGDADIDIRTTRLPSIRPELDDYDPKDYRAPPHEIKTWMAYFNLLRSMFGAGMLAMPLVISQTGMILGPILTVLTGLLILHTHYLLLDCLYEIARQLKIPYISYRYGFRLAVLHGPPAFHFIGKHGPSIVAAFMFASQLGICTMFVTFTTDSLRDLMDWQSSEPALICLIFPYLILVSFMKDFSIVSYVAMFGNLLNLTSLIIVFVHLFMDAPGEPTIAINTNAKWVLLVWIFLLVLDFTNFHNLLSSIQDFWTIAVLLIDKSLVNTRHMTSRYGVLNVGIICPTIMFVIFGCLGYWAFGTMDENILRSLPLDENSSMAAIALYLVSVASAYPLQCYPAITTIVEVIKYHDQLATPSEFTLQLIASISRPLFVILSFMISYIVPFQGPFIAFVGNLCTSMLALVFPALMDICLRYPHSYGVRAYHLIKDLFILALGLASMLFGVYICGYLLHIRILATYSPNNYGFF